MIYTFIFRSFCSFYPCDSRKPAQGMRAFEFKRTLFCGANV